MRLILASQSQRRRELFRLIGLDFDTVSSGADENIPFTSPDEFVKRLAMRKARTVKGGYPGCCVVGADTAVWIDGEMIGKPRDRQDAYRILKKLSGRTHEVYTGLAVLTDGSEQICHVTTLVAFDELSDGDIRAYIDSGEPMDKAGAYGIQGPAAVFVKRIEGDYFNIIGMPLNALCKMLAKAGICPDWKKSGKT